MTHGVVTCQMKELFCLILQAVWFSASGDLAHDAKRDFADIGALRYEPIVLHDLKHCRIKAGGKLSDVPALSKGILFSTYDLLIAGKTKNPKSKSTDVDATGCGLDSSTKQPADANVGKGEFGT